MLPECSHSVHGKLPDACYFDDAPKPRCLGSFGLQGVIVSLVFRTPNPGSDSCEVNYFCWFLVNQSAILARITHTYCCCMGFSLQEASSGRAPWMPSVDIAGLPLLLGIGLSPHKSQSDDLLEEQSVPPNGIRFPHWYQCATPVRTHFF